MLGWTLLIVRFPAHRPESLPRRVLWYAVGWQAGNLGTIVACRDQERTTRDTVTNIRIKPHTPASHHLISWKPVLSILGQLCWAPITAKHPVLAPHQSLDVTATYSVEGAGNRHPDSG